MKQHRSISASLFHAASTAELSLGAFCLFIGLITLADDHGNMRCNQKHWRAHAFHSRPEDVTLEHVQAWVEELEKDLVQIYSVDGKYYLHVRGWHQHQRVDNASANLVPLPPGWTIARENRSGKMRFISRPPADDRCESVATVGSQKSVAAVGGCEWPPEGAAGEGEGEIIGEIEREGDGIGGGPPPALPAHSPPLSKDELEIYEELEVGRDLWPDMAREAVADTARRIERALGYEPRAVGVSRRAVGLKCVQGARSYAARFQQADGLQKLTSCERKLDWILSDMRQGKWFAPKTKEQVKANDQAQAADDEQQRRADQARRRRSPEEAKTMADMLKKLPFMRKPTEVQSGGQDGVPGSA